MRFADRLHNWARAHRWYWQQGRAFSAEGRSRSTRGNEAEYDNGLPPPSAPEDVNIWDAWEVELAWRECSLRSRWCLKYHYHDREHPEVACRLIRRHGHLILRPREWRDYMREARAELQRALDREERRYAQWPRLAEMAAS